MHRRELALLTLAGLAGLTGSARASTAPRPLPTAASGVAPALRLLSEEFAPISFTEKGAARGLAVEVVQMIQQRLGQSLPIEFLPWARAYREAQEGRPTALFSTARIPEREKLFDWVGPIVQFNSAFFARANNRVRVNSLAEARKASKVLVVRDWFTNEQLQGAGFANLLPVSDPLQGLRMLLADRAPLFAGERLSMAGTLAQAGMKPDALREVFSFASLEGYIAFSRNTPPGTVAAWQAQLAEMKRDGSFAAIYKRWLPNDTPPR